MTKLIKSSIFSFLLTAVILGCSGSSGDSIAATPTLTEYQFSATIDLVMATPPFPVALGDTVTGTFSYDPTVKDTAVSPSAGAYVQKVPATVQVIIGSVTLNADLNNWLGYVIGVKDNDSSVSPTRDILSWYVNDTLLAASYGLDYIQLGFSLTDLTASVFNNAAMPDDINLRDYSNGYLFISGSKNNAGLWNLRSKVNSITRVQ